MRLGKVASTTTTTLSKWCSERNAVTASSSWASEGSLRPSVAMFEPSMTRCDSLIAVPSEAANRQETAEGGSARTMTSMVRAVLFDFGGVILTSPFDGFAAYEERVGVAPGTIRSINSTDPDTNAWARLERAEVGIDEFVELFEAEAAALGHTLSRTRRCSRACGGGPSGDGHARSASPRPHFATASAHQQLRHRDHRTGPRRELRRAASTLFDVVVESSRRRRAQARATVLRARARGARHRRGGGGVPRRPRRQPQAGPSHGHDDDQGGGSSTWRSRSSRRSWGVPLLLNRRRSERSAVRLASSGANAAARIRSPAPARGSRGCRWPGDALVGTADATDLVAVAEGLVEVALDRRSTAPMFSGSSWSHTISVQFGKRASSSAPAPRRATGRAARPGPRRRCDAELVADGRRPRWRPCPMRARRGVTAAGSMVGGVVQRAPRTTRCQSSPASSAVALVAEPRLRA